MKTQQAEWFLNHDFRVTEGGTAIWVDFVGENAHILLENSGRAYRAVLKDYNHFHSQEKVDLAFGELVYHFENLVQAE